jgi:endonuclease VIII
VPEGDTILWAATRMRPVLEGFVPDEIVAPQPRHRLERWPERLSGRAIDSIETHGKHLFLVFEGGLVLHSHLGMVGSWRVAQERPIWPGAWLLLRRGERWAVQLRGPRLELLTEGRRRFDSRLAALGPDVLAPEFDARRFLTRLREEDPTRGFGEALLDQHNLAGIGNIWKSEACWAAGIDPQRRIDAVSDEEALRAVEAVRPSMLRSGTQGPRSVEPHVYRRAGRPCSRCGTVVVAHGVGDDNRTTYWCPGCQH